MKIYITLLLCSISTICSAQRGSVLVDASFNGFHCDGKHGICDIDNATNRAQSNTEITFNEDGTLTLKINRSKLSPNDVKSIAGTNSLSKNNSQPNHFIVNENFTLSGAIVKDLTNEEKVLRIKKESYPIQVTNEHLTITFTLE
ncbi:hypothetical protein [Marinirhabdus gelatinilytica]|uniref:Uncharacterized protein n=1 Tax=Marinirhabdus gelatinilytica TaxID=1703343 RepID=A0A370QL42_9FLAO|nr:hypothetical protein [Marinirhabdus gelatinilytica]RDK89093.1 hypothetical protein C8D94_101973 [Marinirhabdus gelatinilytica]